MRTASSPTLPTSLLHILTTIISLLGMVAVPSPISYAHAQLATLEIKGRAPHTGYSRAEFGQRWSDDVDVEFGHNGCDTRNDILTRDLDNRTYKPRTRNCVVLTGTLKDPYTGKTIAFQRGKDTSAAVQIDHVVPLADAWQKGAQSWDAQTRRNFANDPRNLLAVDGPANMQKKASDAATWLPPNKAYRCDYARRIIDVKAAYSLWVTQAEHDALLRQLGTCRS
ncbi:HNH endonuclease family protein [Corynebacterium lizhenjunii]